MQDQDNVYNPLSYDKRQKYTKNTSDSDDGDDVVTGLLPGDICISYTLRLPPGFVLSLLKTTCTKNQINGRWNRNNDGFVGLFKKCDEILRDLLFEGRRYA